MRSTLQREVVAISDKNHQLLVYVNPQNYLAHCFAWGQNLNNIDLLLALGHDFRTAVAHLEQWLEQYQARQPRSHSAT